MNDEFQMMTEYYFKWLSLSLMENIPGKYIYKYIML